MNAEETNLVRKIMLKLGSIPGVRLFRNNVGTAWIGEAHQFKKRTEIIANVGDVLIRSGRIFHGGLCVGSSDIIGLQRVVVTQDMVGKSVAVFTAVEVKTKAGRISKEQTAFVEMVNKNGGVAFVARDENEALILLNR